MPALQTSRRCPRAAVLRRAGFACLALLAAAGAVRAGAWPRDKGHSFVATASQVSATSLAGPVASYSTVYIEHGLGRNLTLGADFGHGISGKGKAVIFLRKSLPERPGGHRLAIELGLGAIAGEAALRPGFSYGRGLTRRGGKGGWISVETTAEIRLDSGRTDFKADFTLGLNHGDRLKTILQLQTGISQGDPSFIRLAPSLVLRTGPAAHIEIGAAAGLVGDDSYGLKLGFWRDF